MIPVNAPTVAGPLLDALISTLQSEQTALVRDEADALAALADAKAQAFDRLARAMRGASRADRLALLDAMTTAQRLNDVNAALVSARMSANRARLDTLLALNGAERAPALYCTRGGLSTAPGRRASASA